MPIRFSHRGPLMQPELMKVGGVLFGGAIPDVKTQHFYSHMWGGMYPGEKFVSLLMNMADGMGVAELMETIEKECDQGFTSLPMNLVLADNQGDIGYMMLAAVPNRKDKTPYIGNRVLNGETTAYDWDGLVPVS
jgi:acyl-homoserine lactone acylase PvdQ